MKKSFEAVVLLNRELEIIAYSVDRFTIADVTLNEQIDFSDDNRHKVITPTIVVVNESGDEAAVVLEIELTLSSTNYISAEVVAVQFESDSSGFDGIIFEAHVQ